MSSTKETLENISEETFARFGKQVAAWLNTSDEEGEGLNGGDFIEGCNELLGNVTGRHTQDEWRTFAKQNKLSTWEQED